MKIAHAQLHMLTNIILKFQINTCKTVGEMLRTTIISVKITSSRGDNSTTDYSRNMKIAHAQLPMLMNIMLKFQISMCKSVGLMLQTTRI